MGSRPLIQGQLGLGAGLRAGSRAAATVVGALGSDIPGDFANATIDSQLRRFIKPLARVLFF